MNKTLIFIVATLITVLLCLSALYFYGQATRNSSMDLTNQPTKPSSKNPKTSIDLNCLSIDERILQHIGYCPPANQLSINTQSHKVESLSSYWVPVSTLASNLNGIQFKGSVWSGHTIGVITCDYSLPNDDDIKLTSSSSVRPPNTGDWSIDVSDPTLHNCDPLKGSIHPVCHCSFFYQLNTANIPDKSLIDILTDIEKNTFSKPAFRVFQQMD